MIKALSLVLLTFVGLMSTASANETLDQAFATYNEAQEAKERESRMEKFKRAQYLFTGVAESGGGNAPIWTNVGTAALQAENLGAAILAFRRALLLDPSYAQAKQNLKHARTLLPSSVPTPSSESMLDSFFFWHNSTTVEQRAGAAALLFLLAGFGFASAIKWRADLLKNLSFFPLIVWAALLVSISVELGGERNLQAVIVIDDTVARASDSVNAPMRFAQPLPAGAEVEVLEIRDRWARISLANGRDAWVTENSFELIDPA